MPIDLRFAPDEAPLLHDLYELTMAASYFALGFNQPSCFYLGVRRMPLKRGFLFAAGIDRMLEALEQFRFEPDALEYLESLKLFAPEFLAFLGNLRFTGDVHAVPEGTIIFRAGTDSRSARTVDRSANYRDPRLNQIGVASMIASKLHDASSRLAAGASSTSACAAVRAPTPV